MAANPYSGHEELAKALENGEITLQGQFVLGSNYTFLVKVKYKEQEIPAVYKPMRGEQPLWDFPPASLAGREMAAWIVSEVLGFCFVPLTVLREGPFGAGSLQQFIEYNPQRHYFNFKPAERQLLKPVALFDLLVNNADRKGSHVLFQKGTRRLFAIDHGLCFHAEDKLRTVIWDFAGEAIPEELLGALRTLHGDEKVFRLLGEYLLPEELAALRSRLEGLLAKPVFPLPPQERRAFPYPPL